MPTFAVEVCICPKGTKSYTSDMTATEAGAAAVACHVNGTLAAVPLSFAPAGSQECRPALRRHSSSLYQAAARLHSVAALQASPATGCESARMEQPGAILAPEHPHPVIVCRLWAEQRQFSAMFRGTDSLAAPITSCGFRFRAVHVVKLACSDKICTVYAA